MQVAEYLDQLISTCEDTAQQIAKTWQDFDEILSDLRRVGGGFCDVTGGALKKLATGRIKNDMQACLSFLKQQLCISDHPDSCGPSTAR
jgi:hypothetical protein